MGMPLQIYRRGMGRVALLQQPPWPHGQGVGLLTCRLPARVPQAVLGDSKLCKFIRDVQLAYACAALASKILQVLHECSVSSVVRAIVL